MRDIDALVLVRDYISGALYKMATDEELGTAIRDAGLMLSDETLTGAAQAALDVLAAGDRSRFDSLAVFAKIGSGAYHLYSKIGTITVLYTVEGDVPNFATDGRVCHVKGKVDWPGGGSYIKRITVESVTEV